MGGPRIWGVFSPCPEPLLFVLELTLSSPKIYLCIEGHFVTTRPDVAPLTVELLTPSKGRSVM